MVRQSATATILVMTAIYEYLHSVTSDEIDRFGHANNLAYLRWTLGAAEAHSTAVGWSNERYTEFGAAFIVRSHQIKYVSPAYLNDRLAIRTWVAELKPKSSLRRFKIYRVAGEQLLCKGTTEWAFVSLQDGRLQALPEEVLEAFKPLAAMD